MLRIALLAVAAALAPAGSAYALSPSVVGEPPVGGGVFRFPQAVAVTPGGSTVFIGDEYSGTVQAFDAGGAPKFTLGYRAGRGEPGRLGVVGGVATDRSGHLFVLDSENERVQVFSASDGRYLASFGDASIFNLLGGDPADGAGISAGGIAVGESGGAPVVYVADAGLDRVDRFVLDATTLTPPSGPPQTSHVPLAAPQGLGLDPAGTHLFVADDDNHRIVVLDPVTLAQTGSFGTFGSGPGQFQNPYDVAVDGRNQLYVADNLNSRVDVFDATTFGFLTTFAHPGYGPGVGNLEIARSVGALSDVPGGGVAAADTANNRVQVFDANGSITAAWGLAGRGPGYLTRPRAVALGPNGGLAVADSFDQRIELFAADGTYAGQRAQISPFTGYATRGANPGQYALPAGVAYDAAGNLWIADTGNDRVTELDPAGAVLRIVPLFQGPLAVASSANGAYVADTGNNRIMWIKPDGGAPEQVGGVFAHPAAVAVDPTTDHPVAADDTSVRDVMTGAAIAGPDGTAWDHPDGLAFDAAGTLYVSELRPGTPNGARVVRRTSGGWEGIAGEGNGPGDVVEPGGLAVTPDGGTLFVADTGNNRVIRFDESGRTPPPTATLTVAIDQIARGTVVSDVAGIACVTDCRQRLSIGTPVTLTARPAAGSILAGWTGACAPAGSAPTCTLTMNADQAAGVSFTAAAPAAPAPTPVATPSPTPPPLPVRVTSVRLKPSVLHLARRHRHATRAKVTIRLTKPATLTIGVLAGRPGRRSGSQCVAPSRARRHARACTRFVSTSRRRTLRAAAAGASFTLTPSFGGRALAVGSYRLAITALDEQGNRVGPVTRAFRIAR